VRWSLVGADCLRTNEFNRVLQVTKVDGVGCMDVLDCFVRFWAECCL